jgi:radical SAM superfamily enzyme YgiQ (UPF0313 family)
VGLDYGVESFDKDQLRSLNRSSDLDQVWKAFRWTQEVGTFATANVILWQPGDTIECFERTGDALRWLRPDEVMPLFFTPFPGTEGAKRCETLPRRTDRLEDYHLLTPILELSGSIATNDLMRLRREMMDNYYLSLEYAELIESRRRQFGERFASLTKVRRDRLLRYGIDIWNLGGPSLEYGPRVNLASDQASADGRVRA